MSYIPVYPASIACKLGPVMENEFERSQIQDFRISDFTLLNNEEEKDYE